MESLRILKIFFKIFLKKESRIILAVYAKRVNYLNYANLGLARFVKSSFFGEAVWAESFAKFWRTKSHFVDRLMAED